jgi:hypothetical protein
MLIVVLLIIGLILFSFSGLNLLVDDSHNHICHVYINCIFIIIHFIILLILYIFVLLVLIGYGLIL